MRRFFGIILSPIHYLFFGLVLCVFHPIQWICFNWFGYQAHKRSVDVLNFFLVSTYYLLGNSVSFINEQNLPDTRRGHAHAPHRQGRVHARAISASLRPRGGPAP